MSTKALPSWIGALLNDLVPISPRPLLIDILRRLLHQAQQQHIDAQKQLQLVSPPLARQDLSYLSRSCKNAATSADKRKRSLKKDVNDAFALSAFLTLFICIISYLLNQDSLSNEVDGLLIKFVADRGLIQKSTKLVSDFLKIQGVEKWNKALQMAVLSFSDQQVLTGLAVLISGYVQLGCRGLAVYHWQIVVDLAFFSSVTHLTTLTCLRTYFQTRKSIRLIRLICMGVLATMLGCALYSTGYLAGQDSISGVEVTFPAWCLYHQEAMHKYSQEREGTDSFSSAYVLVVLLYLGLSYLSRYLSLYPEVSKMLLPVSSLLARCNVLGSLRKKVRDKATRRTFDRTWESTTLGNRGFEDRRPSQSRGSQVVWIVFYRAILSVAHVGQAVKDLYLSVIWEITWLSLALSWGTIRIYEDRTRPLLDLGSTNLDSVLAEVNTWAFGQVVSVILLALPFLSFCEDAYDLRNEDPPHAAYIGQIAPPVPPPTSTTRTNEPASPSSTFQRLSPGDAQEHKGRELYKHIWFRKTVLLTYLLSVAMGADILYNFPYSRGLELKTFLWPYVVNYSIWICLDLFIIWVFSFVSLCMHDVEPDEPALHWKHRWATMPQWKYAIVLNVTVVIFLGASVAYDVVLYYRYPSFLNV